MPRFISCPPGRIPFNANVVVFCFEKAKRPVGLYLYGSSVEKAFAEAKEDKFEGELGQIAVVRPQDKRFARTIFVGLGQESEVTLDRVRRAAAAAARGAIAIGCRTIHLKAPLVGGSFQIAQAVAEGVTLGLYRYTGYQSHPTPVQKLELVLCIAKDAQEEKLIANGLRQGARFANAVCFARDLINRPASDATPAMLVQEARKLAGGNVSVKVFDKPKIQKMGMGAFLGVNRGSWQPPYFLHLTYRPRKKPKRKIGICGKGITFDSGGLSLKPPASMEHMKYDMSGAASVFAIFRALSFLRPAFIEVHGFTPLTENMPGGNAIKPGDVVKTMRGKTIEVLNTDAEGRLVLADALSYACRQNLDEVVDIATLTGACVIALGNQIAGIMGTNAALINRIKDATALSGEKIWELPLEKEYERLIKSDVADVKNIGPAGQAGAIIGGVFLKEFVDKGLPWAHLDIASTSWASTPTPLSDIGSTGVMIRTLLHYILSYN